MSKTTNGVTRKSANGVGAVAAQVVSSVEIKPNLEAVRRRAYELYLERARTGKPGNEIADWVQAERELHTRK